MKKRALIITENVELARVLKIVLEGDGYAVCVTAPGTYLDIARHVPKFDIVFNRHLAF